MNITHFLTKLQSKWIVYFASETNISLIVLCSSEKHSGILKKIPPLLQDKAPYSIHCLFLDESSPGFVGVINLQVISKSCAHKSEEILCFGGKFSHSRQSFTGLLPKTLRLEECTQFEVQTKSPTDFAIINFYCLRAQLSVRLLRQKTGLVWLDR